MNRRAHSIHIFVKLAEPLDVPDGYVVHMYPDGTHYTGRAITSYVSEQQLDATRIFSGSILCRFVHRTVHHTFPIDDAVNVARDLWPTLPALESPPEDDTDQVLEPAKQVTVVEIMSGVWFPDPDCEGMVGEENLEISLDLGLYLIRCLQRSVYAITRQPYTLVTRQSIPFMVPMAIGLIDGHQSFPPSTLGFWSVNDNVLAEVPPASVENLTLVDRRLSQVDTILFNDHLDLMRESTVAHRNRGDNRTAALLGGLACERLLDDLLACLLWEEGLVYPEDAVEVYKDPDGIVRRVRRAFHVRLSGWDAEGDALESWRLRITNLRNKVAHGNYEPTDDEIIALGDSVVELVKYCSTVLANQARKRSYPRAAYSLMGDSGLRDRQAWTRYVRDTAEEFERENQWQIVARWKEATNRLRADVFQEGVEPDPSRAYCMLVVLPQGGQYFVQHDRVACRARVLGSDVGLSVQQARGLPQGVAVIRNNPDVVEPVVIEVLEAESMSPLSQWVEEYRLIPGAGVMISGDDLRESDYDAGLH